MRIEKLPTDKLTAYRDEMESLGNWDEFERAEKELERRDDEPPHDDSPALDPPWWEYR